nr:unnamed protein product [Digitaria exilis]
MRFDHAEYSRHRRRSPSTPPSCTCPKLRSTRSSMEAAAGGRRAVHVHGHGVPRVVVRVHGVGRRGSIGQPSLHDCRCAPPLPDEYLSNAILRASAVAKSGDGVTLSKMKGTSNG